VQPWVLIYQCSYLLVFSMLLVSMIKTGFRFLLSLVGFFLVAWPIVSLISLIVIGLSILLLGVGPSVVEPFLNQVWSSLTVGITVIIALVCAGVFIRRSSSLRRLALFVPSAFLLTLVFGLVLLFILGMFFDTAGMSSSISSPASSTLDFGFSLFVFAIGYVVAYLLVYQNSYARLKGVVGTTPDR
jgi:uncharacterized membrane protein